MSACNRRVLLTVHLLVLGNQVGLDTIPAPLDRVFSSLTCKLGAGRRCHSLWGWDRSTRKGWFAKVGDFLVFPRLVCRLLQASKAFFFKFNRHSHVVVMLLWYTHL